MDLGSTRGVSLARRGRIYGGGRGAIRGLKGRFKGCRKGLALPVNPRLQTVAKQRTTGHATGAGSSNGLNLLCVSFSSSCDEVTMHYLPSSGEFFQEKGLGIRTIFVGVTERSPGFDG
jgi:hypothetical protein